LIEELGVKKTTILMLHTGLLAVFILIAQWYLGIAGGGATFFSSDDAYKAGSYHFALFYLGLIPLVLLCFCFLGLIPQPFKWLPFIGLALLCWETAPILSRVPCAFFPQLFWAPTVGALIAIIASIATIRQGLCLWRNYH
jgi:hypothetical protein